jgi:hypothetical protein
MTPHVSLELSFLSLTIQLISVWRLKQTSKKKGFRGTENWWSKTNTTESKYKDNLSKMSNIIGTETKCKYNLSKMPHIIGFENVLQIKTPSRLNRCYVPYRDSIIKLLREPYCWQLALRDRYLIGSHLIDAQSCYYYVTLCMPMHLWTFACM